MNFIENETAEKLRGGYYTPADLAGFLARWVAAANPMTVLEPSCGDGAFLEALAQTGAKEAKITAFEVDAVEAGKAHRRAHQRGLPDTTVHAEDFLDWALKEMDEGGARFDAVIGNPPFIRYQYLPGVFQQRAEKIFAALRCRFTKHTNAWVPFILASISLLRPGGRLAMVVPSEILHVLHAQSLRSLLGHHCSKLVIMDPEEIWFTDTLQGVVLLMAEKRINEHDKAQGVGIIPVRGRSFTRTNPQSFFDAAKPINGRTVEGKWTRALLGADVLSLLDDAEALPRVHRFADVAQVDVGIVTGANNFFLINDEVVREWNLQRWVRPMFGRSSHAPGVIYDDAQHAANVLQGYPTNFVWLKGPDVENDVAARAYIAEGEQQKLHTRFKCRVRKPWYTVPSVRASQVGMLKRAHDAPRLILNRLGALTTDTAYRIQPFKADPAAFVAGFVNPLTALSCELEGRTYGGGVLELVPSEIEKILVPCLDAHEVRVDELDSAVRAHSMARVLEGHGCRVLHSLGLSPAEAVKLHESWSRLRLRRQRVQPENDEQDEAA